MSGQSGASREETYFFVEYTSGILVNVATSPAQKNPDEVIRQHFEETSRPYQQRLDQVIHDLNHYFSELASLEAFPIVAYRGAREWIYGVVIEDTNPSIQDVQEVQHGENWLRNARGKGAYVKTSVRLEKRGFEIVTVTFAVNSPIKRSQIDQIEQKIQDLFQGKADGPG